MTTNDRPKKPQRIDRTQIARAVFADAESMGLRDRARIEELAGQVIERLEQKPLPGMEDLVPSARPKKKSLDAEIQAILRELMLREEQPTREKETRPEMTTTADSPKVKSSPDLKLTDNAVHVLERRYLKKDRQGKPVESPADMFRRVAGAIASAETNYDSGADVSAWAEKFYRAMTDLEFLPNSPTLMNAGRELGQLSACFVLPVDDSMESIFDAVKYTALIHKSGGGTGFSFSRLRPEKDRVGSTGGVASGPVSFMRAFDTATDVIKQGGMRRGANMAILNVDHPDILRFIHAKEDSKALTNFNLSVAVTTEFMEAVKAAKDYALVNPHTREVAGKLNAREVFDKIVDMAWRTGDPGVVFIDQINRFNPTPHLGKIESTNPCGEQPLLPYESCNLGSINLARMVTGGKIDYPRLAETVKTAVRFLDDVIDVNNFPLPEIAEMTRKTRKIGLGVMGFADMLIMLGIPYDSEEARRVASDVMRFISEEATHASVELAEKRGVFPAFAGSVYDMPGGPRVRNASRTTIAPTGTLSIIAGCSGGIEPLYALSFTRNILDGDQLVEANPWFEEAAKRGGFYSKELVEKLARGTKLSDVESIPDSIRRLFVTAHEIDPEGHVLMQSAFQKYTDNAVSKTVNFPHDATREDIANVYRLAYREGLKGITIYRDGSRDTQVLTTAPAEKKTGTEPAVLTPRKRPKVTSGITEKVTTGCGTLYVTVNSDEHGICEVFSTLGKAGGCAAAQLEATCRLISLALRAGLDVASVVRQLRGIRCPSIAWEEGKSVLSCADAIASVLERHLPGTKAVAGTDHNTDTKAGKPDYGLARNLAGQCPECGNLLTYQEGCFICTGCGFTRC